jgi:hypothetical protein
MAILERAALHAVLASLRDLNQPSDLFRQHTQAYAEFWLILSVVPAERHPVLAYDILDGAFLLRWNELVAERRPPNQLSPPDPPCDDADRRLD